MDFSLIAYLTYNLIVTFALERFMSGFFGDRRTSLRTALLSYAAYYFLIAASFIFIGIPLIQILVSFVIVFAVSLNYTAKLPKRIFAVVGIMSIILIVEGVFALLSMLYIPNFLEQLDTLESEFTWVFIAMGPTLYLIALIFIRFKNIRKNKVTLPFLFWFSSLLIPSASIIMLYAIVIYMPQGAGVVGLISIFLINMMVFYLHDSLSSVYEEKIAAKNRFLARMSHEIRTPISTVMSISEIELRNQQMPPHTESAFIKIYDASKILLKIVSDILDFTKIETGNMPLVNAEYDVASLVNDAAQLHLVYLERKGVTFQMFVDSNLPVKLIGDVLRIRQIISNLLTNSFKFTESGTVTLSLECEKEKDGSLHIVISVQDTGIGMTTEQLEEVKGLQVRYVNSRKQENLFLGGTGLGIPIICDLVKMMNAHIDIKSEVSGANKGTHIIVRIPQELSRTEVLGEELANCLQNFESSARSIAGELEFEPMQIPHGKVLVVDDIDINLYVAEAMLETFGLTVDLCACGQEAISKIKEGKAYDIIFMDHMMPDMDGVEVTKILRDMGYNHPIVALTANAVKGQAGMFMENGFSGFMSKPIDIKLLNSHLMRFIGDGQSVN
ncbi:MAG: response regulator [Defluviitaleaceae bacterium]|nr:response regulator [Defluviitaleaceae bacterium]